MSAWLESPEGAGLTMLGTIVTTVVVAILRALHKVKLEQRAMQAIPPTPPPTPAEALTARVEQLEMLLRRERWRITEFERQATELGKDHASTAAALAAERAKNEQLERYVKELEARLHAIESGHTPPTSLRPPSARITLAPRSDQIVEIDDTPTPRHGHRILRPKGTVR